MHYYKFEIRNPFNIFLIGCDEFKADVHYEKAVYCLEIVNIIIWITWFQLKSNMYHILKVSYKQQTIY